MFSHLLLPEKDSCASHLFGSRLIQVNTKLDSTVFSDKLISKIA